MTDSMDLCEIDWLIISDYLDPIHNMNLYWLSSSSNGSIYNLNLKLPWILLLHDLDPDLRNRVIEMVQNGIIRDIYTILFGVFVLDPWYSSLYRSIDIDQENILHHNVCVYI